MAMFWVGKAIREVFNANPIFERSQVLAQWPDPADHAHAAEPPATGSGDIGPSTGSPSQHLEPDCRFGAPSLKRPPRGRPPRETLACAKKMKDALQDRKTTPEKF